MKLNDAIRGRIALDHDYSFLLLGILQILEGMPEGKAISIVPVMQDLTTQ